MAEDQEPREYTLIKIDEEGQEVELKYGKGFTGSCKVNYRNGDYYEGTYKEGVRDGQGVYTYAGESGNKYEGEWKNNLKNGIGKMTYGTTAEYYGHFENGKREGEGVYKYLQTKDLYSGNWKNGLKHGKGTFIFSDTKMKIVGEWANGQIIQGKWIFANGTYFEGVFENNYPKGEGLWHFVNGNVVKGEFTHELKDAIEHDKQETVLNWITQREEDKKEIFIE